MDPGALHAQAQLLGVSQALLQLIPGARIALVIHHSLRQIDRAFNRELSLAEGIRLLRQAGKFGAHSRGVSLSERCFGQIDLGNEDHVWLIALRSCP